jgi:predicted nuclease with TOPRIM domain
MEQKTKFIIIGLAGLVLFCLFLFAQAQNSKQIILRELNDAKTENASLNSKIGKLEDDLKANQNRITSLQDDLGKLTDERNDLQKRFEAVNKVREELVIKLKAKAAAQQKAAVAAEPAPNTDPYWASILKAKNEMELQLLDIRSNLKTLKINNESLQRERSALQLDINSLRNEKQDLLRQLDYNQKLLDSMAQEVVRERNDKSRIQESFRAFKSENEVLSRQLKSLNGRKIILDRRVQDLQESKAAVDRRLSEMEVMLSDRISQIDSLKGRMELGRNGKPAALPLDSKSRESVELPAIVVHSAIGDKKSKDADSTYAAKILAVNQDSRFVVIDAGLNAGIKIGDSFNVYREGQNIGTITVIQARNDISACDIRKEIKPLKIDDGVK